MKHQHTPLLPISPHHPDETIIHNAIQLLQSGGVVAFPTETVYGLGADALNPEAVARVFTAKGRPADNPLIVHIAFLAQLYDIATDISPTAKILAETFWPGPLTLVVKSKKIFPSIITSGLETVALRIPNHPVPIALIKGLPRGLVGPSANISGKPSPTTAQHVYDDLAGKIDMILDAGPTAIGLESTVIDVTENQPLILRLGGLTREKIEEVVGYIQLAVDTDMLKRSPGTRHRHYAPRAVVVLVEQGRSGEFERLFAAHNKKGQNIGAIVHSKKLCVNAKGHFFITLSDRMEEYSRHLFAAMRTLDERGADVILVETVDETGLGKTIMDRLRRATEKKEEQ